MEAHEVTLGELLKGGVSFQVPPFQRRYAWRQREFERLWDDIARVIAGEQKRHFMGTVVLEPERRANQFAIIDGQQRLGTFTVILKVLRELSDQYGQDSRRTLHAALFANGNPRFVPSLHDQDAFNLLLASPALLKKVRHKNVWACHDYFARELSNYIETEKGQKPRLFRDVLDAVLNNLIFVRLCLTSEDDAQGIFETINYVGVPLTAADLARNFVLSRARRGLEQERLNQEYWQKIEDALEEGIDDERANVRRAQLQKILPEFLRAILIVENGKYISFSDLYRALRVFFGKGSIEDNLQLTLNHARVFRNFLNPNHEQRIKVREQLRRFINLRMTTHYPLLLIVYRAYRAKRIGAEDLLRAMKFIESFVVRRAFNAKVSRDLNLVFARITGELKKHARSKNVSAMLRIALSKARWPRDREFRENFVSSPIYANAPAIARFTLISIENLNSNAKEKVTDKTVQIDHVFPQQPGSGWHGNLAELKKNLHAIGNLTLTAYNQHYSNKSFKGKMVGPNGLRRSPYWLNKTMARKKEWTADAINKRGKLLLTQGMKLWPGP
ncbi:MAG: DUF262 domain-containing protein [Betaproteobacteria bacterium]|nr:DUF262 domain-containing protein [Betaproteobacteria bacterium]